MDGLAGTSSRLTWAVHISTALLVALWLFPTLGLLISSFRTADQISQSGWWASMFPSEQRIIQRAADPDEFRSEDGDKFIVSGTLFAPGTENEVIAWGTSSRQVDAYRPGDIADLGDGESMRGNCRWIL